MKNNIQYMALTVLVLTVILAFFLSPNKIVPTKPVNQERKKEHCYPGSIKSDLRSVTAKKNSLYKVPNIIHYIWYKDKEVELRFDQALSVLSAIKFIKPKAVYFHTNMEPTGQYYHMLKNNSLFKAVQREPPREVFKPRFETDYSNFDRIKILIEQGGIYLDLDIMIVQPFDDLRKYDCTLGMEMPNLLCTGVILCVKNYPFLYLLLNSYLENVKYNWAYGGRVATCLAKRFKGMIHIENTKFHRPCWNHMDQIWGNVSYPWQNNYSVHTWIRLAMKTWIKEYPTPESIKIMNNTYGQIARRVFYGSPNMTLQV